MKGEIWVKLLLFFRAGLLPISVAGVDTEAFLRGWLQVENDFSSDGVTNNDAYQYALVHY